MKKSVVLAVVASMLVSANVAMAGFGVKVPGASKPAASSSQEAVDLSSIRERGNILSAGMASAVLNALNAQTVFDDLIGKVDKETIQAKKALENDPSPKNVKNAAKRMSVLAKKSTTTEELAKANVEEAKVDAAFATSKDFIQKSYKEAAGAGAGAAVLLTDATKALKSLKPTDSTFGEITTIVDVCKLAGSYVKELRNYEKMIGSYKTYRSKKK